MRPQETKVIRCANILLRRVLALDLHQVEETEVFRAIHLVKTIVFAQAGFRTIGGAGEADAVPEQPEAPPVEPTEPTVAEIKAAATKKATVLARPSASALREIAGKEI
jgi:hypothetical protein